MFTIPQIAKLLDRNPITVNRLVHDGRLKATRYGRMLLIDPADFRKFMDEGGCRPGGRPKKVVTTS